MDISSLTHPRATPIPFPYPGCPARPGWTVKRLPGDRAQIMAHHGLRTIAHDVRADEADTLVQAVNAHHDLVKALRDVLDALDWARQVVHPSHRETLDILTERAQATFAAVRS